MEDIEKRLIEKKENRKKFWELLKDNHEVFLHKKPLEIGIDKVIRELYQKEIEQLSLDKVDLKILFKYHVTSFKYLINLLKYKKRYNINNKSVSVIDDACKVYAKSHLSYLKAKKKKMKDSCDK